MMMVVVRVVVRVGVGVGVSGGRHRDGRQRAIVQVNVREEETRGVAAGVGRLEEGDRGRCENAHVDFGGRHNVENLK